MSLLWVMLLSSLSLFTACPKDSVDNTTSGFFKTQGPNILDASGKPVVLRGVGLGGWLMPEGYMLKIAAPDGGLPTSIMKQITALIGKRATHELDANSLAGLIPVSGHTITHFTIRKERGQAQIQAVIGEFAPIYHDRADEPPLLLINGDRELELWGRYEENAFMMRMMKVAGHTQTEVMELDGYDHGMVEPAIPLVLKQMNKILKQ